MNPVTPGVDQENLQEPQAPAEISSYPVQQEEYVPEIPAEQTYVQPEIKEVVSAPEAAPVNSELQPTPVIEQVEAVPQSSTPEMHTNIEKTTSREGELAFQNVELGKATFRGGVTSQQVVSQVSGYYNVNQGLVSDPQSGLLQQTAQRGDPTNGTTWQAAILSKILEAFWKVLGK